MPDYKTPGVYIEEISKFPPSIAAPETALPVFIGHTEKAEREGHALTHTPTRISSQTEYELFFGGGPARTVTLRVDAGQQLIEATADQLFYLYDSIRLFFANGGGPCLIVSVGNYGDEVSPARLTNGLNAVSTHPEPTLLAMPDLVLCHEAHTLEAAALAQCAQAPNRFAVFDIGYAKDAEAFATKTDQFKQRLGTEHLKYGAAYGPWLVTNLSGVKALNQLTFTSEGATVSPESLAQDERMRALITQIHEAEEKNSALCAQLFQQLYNQYAQARQWIDTANFALNTLPPCGAVMGVYAEVDRNRGVWKAPANVSLNGVMQLVFELNNQQQETYNIDVNSGKSINLLRSFTGKGFLIWGARTLAGNDNEWRYINVRRLCSWLENAIRQGLQAQVFEPNDANTWMRAQAMIENFLTMLWRQGAFQGSKPEHAFFVHVGLGKTMTANDIAQGLMIIEFGLAVVRPAEFIILKIAQKQSAA